LIPCNESHRHAEIDFRDEYKDRGVSLADDLAALPVWALEMFRQIYVLLRKSHSRPWGNEVFVPIGNAQVVLGIEDVDLV
jgi:hypothetical protein